MTNGYVYHRQLIAAEEIDKIIDAVKNAFGSSEHYYFLRYSHKVSGICLELPQERGEIEGQMFNVICELRWKKHKAGYEALILSKHEITLDGFEALIKEWKICDRKAFWHKEEPKFPKGFQFKGTDNQDINSDNIKIHQRYFQDSATATVHFVALTVKANDSNT
ncbi:hypothetical protein [Calothrix sp. UHCC 0171]|uniref:hypothetical protein n=1 Tax=Calothrix sp. UHCC 0171 TaxID=3110245 RepID=UPI002B2077D3|nr:hypothetical protein [Calothrix sp. UHCC 0171]MEA5573547.1 hypothetical protein [Calothrix sp. UHCC 0171]